MLCWIVAISVRTEYPRTKASPKVAGVKPLRTYTTKEIQLLLEVRKFRTTSYDFIDQSTAARAHIDGRRLPSSVLAE